MITIRKATKDDWKIVQKLNNEVFEDNAPYDPHLHLGYPFEKAGLAHYKKVVLSKIHCTLIAFDGVRAVGHIVGGPKSIDFRNVKSAEVIELGVSPAYRSKGVGTMLVAELKKWATLAGYQTLMVNAYAANDKAIVFYKRQGFSPIDIDFEMDL